MIIYQLIIFDWILFKKIIENKIKLWDLQLIKLFITVELFK